MPLQWLQWFRCSDVTSHASIASEGARSKWSKFETFPLIFCKCWLPISSANFQRHIAAAVGTIVSLQEGVQKLLVQSQDAGSSWVRVRYFHQYPDCPVFDTPNSDVKPPGPIAGSPEASAASQRSQTLSWPQPLRRWSHTARCGWQMDRRVSSASLPIPYRPFDVSGPLPWTQQLKTHLWLIMNIVCLLQDLNFTRWLSALEMQDLTCATEERRRGPRHGVRPLDLHSPGENPPPPACIVHRSHHLPDSHQHSSFLFIQSDFDLSFVAVRSFEPLFNY